jgi:hypothetical protein
VALSGVATKPDDPLTGTLGANPTAVTTGSEVQLVYAAANPNATAVDASLTLIVKPAGSANIAAQWNIPVSIVANGSVGGNKTWTPTGPVGTAYTATLTATVGTPSKTTTLANANFSVVAPTIKLDAELKNTALPRILMLVNCSSTDNAGSILSANMCTENKATAIRSYLTSQALAAKVVTTRAEFETEMRCGNYNTYWVDAGSRLLTNTSVKELREAVERGSALVLEGQSHINDVPLQNALGLQTDGLVSQANQTITIDSIPLGGGTLATVGNAVKYTLSGATSLATFASGEPAIAAGEIGRGRGLAFAFDLGSLMAQSPSGTNDGLNTLLKRSLAYLAPSSGLTAVTGGPVYLQALVSNTGQLASSLTALAYLPTDAKVLATQPQASATVLNGRTQLSWTLGSIAPGESMVISVQVGFTTPGTITVPIEFSGSAPGAANVKATLNPSVLVQDKATVDGLVNQELSALKPSTPAENSALSTANNAVGNAKAFANQGDYANSLAQWINAADQVRTITSVDTSRAKQSIAYALQSSERQLCGQWACVTGALNFTVDNVVTRQVALRSTIVGTRTVYNNCPAQIKDIPVISSWVNRRTGEEVQHLWDNYTLPGNSNNQRGNGWQALGNENDIVDVVQTAQWRNEILHLNRDSFQIVVYPPVLKGSISLSLSRAKPGQTITISRSVTNSGAIGKDIPISLRIVNVTQGNKVVQTYTQTSTFNPGETNTSNVNWQVQGVGLDKFAIELIATVSGSSIALARNEFTIDK